jgi:acyl-CoA synthetase (AMP-forming)/AMP-acid ligase II
MDNDGAVNARARGGIADVLWDSAHRHAARTAVTDLGTGVSRTYEELVARVGGVAGALAAHGLKPGDRVALLLRNSIAYVEALLGSAAAGLVVVPLNIRLTVEDFRHMLSDSGAAALITEEEFLPALSAAVDLTSLLVVDASASGASTWTTLEDLALGPARLDRPVEVAPKDLCSLMYTSGTTGAPKAVMLPHRSWTSVSDVAARVLRFGADEAILHAAPLTHGAGFLLLPTLGVGGVNLVCRSFEPALVAKLFADGDVTGVFMVPSMIRLLLDVLPDGWEPSDRLRNVYYAGSPIDPLTLREATQRFHGRLVQSFAQMESPMFFAVLDEADHRRATVEGGERFVRSAGKVLPGVTLRVLDEHGQSLPAGSEGEIVARAPQTMLGYWNRLEDTQKTLADGWLHTGDVGYLDDDGYLFVVDRLKDMIVTGGSNVYAREVEEVLLAVPGVREAAVVGTPHRVWGEAVTAVLVGEGAVGPDDAVLAACRARLADYKVPKRVVWLDELPRNAYGKVLKRQLRSQLEEPFPSPSSSGAAAIAELTGMPKST